MHLLGAHTLALLAPLLHEAQLTLAATMLAVDDSYPDIQRLAGQCLDIKAAYPPLVLLVAQGREYLAQPTDTVLTQMLIDFQAYFILTR